MAQTAKIFKNGRSQAVRLPKEFRFDGKEVEIRHGDANGEVVLAPKPETQKPSRRKKPVRSESEAVAASHNPGKSSASNTKAPRKLTAQELYKLFDEAGFPDDFLADREVHMPRDLDLF